MTKLIKKWWTKKEVSNTLTLARVVSLYKKGDPEKQENYRPISLLNTFYKVIAAAIQRRLGGTLDNLVMKTQYGSGNRSTTTDALFVAKRMQEYAERAGQKGVMILLDKASDNRTRMAIQDAGLPRSTGRKCRHNQESVQEAGVLCRSRGSQVKSGNANNRD